MNLFARFRRARTPLEFLLRHESTIRRLAADEQRAGQFTAWLSRAVEALDERHQFEDITK